MFTTNDVEKYLNKNYIKAKRGWFFNKSKDRYIAEYESSSKEEVTVNPSFCYSHFSTIFVEV